MLINAETARALIRTKVAGYKNQKQAAGALGVSTRHLGRILNGHSAPGLLLLKGLGLKRVIAYVVAEPSRVTWQRGP